MTIVLEEPLVEEPQPVRKRVITPLRVVIAAGVAAVVAFVATYVVFFTPDSPPALALSTPSAGAAPTGGAPAGVWKVGDGSVAGYRVREKLVKLPASNDAVGRTNAVTGSLRLDSTAGGFVVKAGLRLDADLSTLKSDEDLRDQHIHTMAIETDRFPTATFVSTSDLAVPADSSDASALVRGELTLHGVTRTVDVPVHARYDGSRIEVVGSLSFPWALFDIQAPHLSYVSVEADPTMEFQLFFDHTAA